jgi:hypothetical protein
MKGRGGGEPDVRSLAAYLEGEVTASEAAALEAQLAERPAARRRLAELREMGAALGQPVPELEAIDLAARVGRAIRSPAPIPRRRTPVWAGLLALGAAGAAAAILVGSPRHDEFLARSAAAGSTDGERWAGVQAYRVGEAAGAPRPLGEQMAAGDALVFSYTNLGPRPFAYLMIFAVDARGEVRWFQPAYETPGSDPPSIGVAAGQAEAPLGEVVRHDFAPGPLVIYAVFSRQPLHVRQVEAVVGGARGAPAGLPFEDTVVRRLSTQITP